jgi:hypothetical protein
MAGMAVLFLRHVLILILIYLDISWCEALFGELSWFGAKGAMEAAEREGLLSEEAANIAVFHGIFNALSCPCHILSCFLSCKLYNVAFHVHVGSCM